MKRYQLLAPNGEPYLSDTPGTIGGNSALKIYGRLDCPSALSWIARGHYVPVRVFFASISDAIAAGYRPCGRCLRVEYQAWKDTHPEPA